MSSGGGPGGLPAAAQRRAGRPGAAGYAFLLCLATLCAVGLVGLLLHQPYLFPSLGPMVMLFFETPAQKAATPRNTVVGHGVAILAGWGCLILFGLAGHPSVLGEGLTGPRIAAAALSVAVTALVLHMLDCPHPPAGATTLLISLGLLTSPSQLLSIALAVLIVTALSVVLNRLLGVRQHLW